MSDCLFCKIANGEIPVPFFFENDDFVVFNDIHPQAPVHLLIVPKFHTDNIQTLATAKERSAFLESLFSALPQIAEKAGVHESGFRLINNCGRDGGQTVNHLHFHLLGGRQLEV